MAGIVDKVKARVRARETVHAPDPLVDFDLAQHDTAAETAAMPAPRVAQPTNAEWWNENFDWGGDGAFDECVGIAEGNVEDPEAFCAQRHYDALGKWPSEKGSVVAVALPGGVLASAFVPTKANPETPEG